DFIWLPFVYRNVQMLTTSISGARVCPVHPYKIMPRPREMVNDGAITVGSMLFITQICRKLLLGRAIPEIIDVHPSRLFQAPSPGYKNYRVAGINIVCRVIRDMYTRDGMSHHLRCFGLGLRIYHNDQEVIVDLALRIRDFDYFTVGARLVIYPIYYSTGSFCTIRKSPLIGSNF